MQWYSARQVANMLNAAPATIIGLCEDGDLGAVNIARKKSVRKRWRISDEHIADFQNRRENKPTTAKTPTRRVISKPTRDYFAAQN
jgi:hypothetical protein